jgi:diphthamide biosynthesis enzyme Dph1/Dph2-like protein
MINEDYDLELEKVLTEIRKHKARKVLVQLGEGLKPRAKEIQEYIQDKLKDSCQIYFWLNSCYGKCDIPEILDDKKNDFDMLIQFGH